MPLEAPRAAGVYPLVDPAAWRIADLDPFASLRPEEVDCPEDAWGAEELSGEQAFSVDTQDCGYLTVSQPALVALRADDTLALRLWHFDLTGPSDAVANLGLALDTDVAWREVLPIPRDSELLTPSIRVPDDLAEGAPVTFHVSNHGSNSYSLLTVALVVDESGP